MLTRNLGRVVDGAVIDDEDVGLGNVAPQLVEDRRQALLLVPGWDEDQRVALFGHLHKRNDDDRIGLPRADRRPARADGADPRLPGRREPPSAQPRPAREAGRLAGPALGRPLRAGTW